MAKIKQFTKTELLGGFKLTDTFLMHPISEEAITKIHSYFPKKRLVIITQTSIQNRGILNYKTESLSNELLEKLELRNVISKLRDNKRDLVPQVDGLWKFKDMDEDIIMLTFSQTAPIIMAECDEGIFISTMLKQDISKDTFKYILSFLPPCHSRVTFKVISSTCFQYPEGTLSDQIKHIVFDLGQNFEETSPDADVNSNSNLFGYGEKVPDFPDLGLANNLVAIM